LSHRVKAVRHISADRMLYVYVIRSRAHPKRYYIGFTENIDQRVKEHNEGKSLHTAKYGPWELAFYLAVPSKPKALDLERCLKSGSGRAFLQRHIL
jgi:putative endonuclease